MRWLKFIVTVLSVACTMSTPAQTLKPDTLQDLKAEYEYQRAEIIPLAAMYQDAQAKRMACYEEMIKRPLETDCKVQNRELKIIADVSADPMNKYLAAKDAYERELRKASRK